MKEGFKSKSQQKFFYTKKQEACKKDSSSQKCKKWKKYVDEFSSKTKYFDKLPSKVDETSLKEYIEQNNPYNKKLLPKGSLVVSVKKDCQFNNNCLKGDINALKMDLIKEYITKLITK